MSDSEPIAVISKDGVRGSLAEGLPADANTTYVPVRFENGQLVFVPVEALTPQADGRYYYLNLRLDQLEPGQATAAAAGESYVVPVIQEELDVQRRRVETGRIRVEKRVHTRTELVDQPLLREELHVERVPINQIVEQPSQVRTEGNTTIVPVFEEVLVVEKRLLLKEELRITRRTIETRDPQEVELRSEEVLVERIAGAGDASTRAANEPE
jgi:uncharacterized protein (TIGR02271 family)